MNRLLFFVFIFICSCSYDKLNIASDESGYPPQVSAIIKTKCAMEGCHNRQSKNAAGGFSFETWDDLFEGGNGGAAVIPFRPDHSVFMFIVNTDSANGIILAPTMPYNAPPLSQNEYGILKEWINKGAPDINGVIKFSDASDRIKLYVGNQGEDAVTVLDARSRLAMRFIRTGDSVNEVIHSVKVSPDNDHWFTIYSQGSWLRKFRTSDNTPEGSLLLGNGSWSSMDISKDSQKIFALDKDNGVIKTIAANAMNIIDAWPAIPNMSECTLNKNDDTLYVTTQSGNYIYKIPVANPSMPIKVSLNPSQLPDSTPSLDPHQIVFNSDYSEYFVSCQRSNEIRVMSTSNDSLRTVIQTGEFPVDMAISEIHQYLFVTCMSQINSGTTILGEMDVIDLNTTSIIRKIQPGHQPHGIAISDQLDEVFIANRNISHGGPVPHHPSPYGRNGYIVAVNMSTLQLVPDFKAEVSVDPYSVVLSK